MSKSEAILWTHLNNRQLHGYRFLRQYGIASYVLDFYCPKLRLAVEVDGKNHLEAKTKSFDEKRQMEIETLGIVFLRIKNELILNNVNNVVDMIERRIQDIVKP
jgi:very-short-patch-repair endonuclease